jgi:hypothetical protein
MRPYSFPSILSSTLVATLLLGGACKKAEEPAATTPPPADKKETPPPPPPPVLDAAPPKPKFTEVTGFQTPESVLPLADQDVYLVSNINGEPGKADGNGFISKVGPDGKVVELKWIEGGKNGVKLDAPKGMAVRGGELYVADITHVRVFDLATGKSKKDIEIKGASFLNDVAADADSVYVTDSGLTPDFKPTGSDAVYQIGKDDKAKKLIADKELKGPNGLYVADGKVWVVSYGAKELYHVDGGKKADVTELPAGALDGIDALGDGRIAVSSWEAKAVFAGKPGDAWKPLIEGVESPADISVDAKRKQVLVPMMMSNVVRFYPIE